MISALNNESNAKLSSDSLDPTRLYVINRNLSGVSSRILMIYSKAQAFFTPEGLKRIQLIDQNILEQFLNLLERADREKLPIDPQLDLSQDALGAARLRLNATNGLDRLFQLNQKCVMSPSFGRLNLITACIQGR